MPNFLDKVPLGVEGLEPVQHAVGSVEGSKLDLIAVTLALLKIDEPLLSPQFDVVVERRAVLEVGNRGANSRSSPIEISLGPAKFASSRFQLSLEGLNPRLGRPLKPLSSSSAASYAAFSKRALSSRARRFASSAFHASVCWVFA